MQGLLLAYETVDEEPTSPMPKKVVKSLQGGTKTYLNNLNLFSFSPILCSSLIELVALNL